MTSPAQGILQTRHCPFASSAGGAARARAQVGRQEQICTRPASDALSAAASAPAASAVIVMTISELANDVEHGLAESQNQRDARVEQLWAKLEPGRTGEIDLKGLQKGLRKLDHREPFSSLFGLLQPWQWP